MAVPLVVSGRSTHESKTLGEPGHNFRNDPRPLPPRRRRRADHPKVAKDHKALVKCRVWKPGASRSPDPGTGQWTGSRHTHKVETEEKKIKEEMDKS